MTTQAAAYCRISSDPTGEGLGVERQRDDCAALVAARGWTLTRTLTDNDLSAYSGKPRPAYRDLLDGIRAGTVEAVVAWHPDRLHRSPAELEEFIGLVERHGVVVQTVQAGQWDLSSPSGRMSARTLGNVARYESEHKSERVRRALEQNASKGKPHGRRAYGWTREHDVETGKGRDVIDPAEAAIVREVAERIIGGDSLRSICANLNARGLYAPAGKPWGKTSLRAVVVRERNAGLRVHHGEVVGDGAWDSILDRGTYEQVRAILEDPTRRTSTGTAAAHLLSGIARCGVCGAPMRSGMNRTVKSYRCAGRGCVSRRRADVDALVREVLVRRLALPDARSVFATDRSAEQAAAADDARGLRARLDRAADDYADGKIDARQMERITARIRPALTAAEARARVVDDSPLLDGLLDVEDVRTAWDALPLTRRRAVVDLMIEVRVMRAEQGARSFDPATVAVEWRT